jgi:hypothetical protein
LDKLPEYRLIQLELFASSLGVAISSLTSMHKIAWLRSLMLESPPPTAHTLYCYGRGLYDLGPTDHAELERQAAIVRAFTLEMKGSRLLSPPKAPSRAMPVGIFRKVLATIGSPTNADAIRDRTAFKLAWSVGLAPIELSRLRRDWITPLSDGFLLDYQAGLRNRRRKLPVVRSSDPSMCAARELKIWLRNVPCDARAFVFPRRDQEYALHWFFPVDSDHWGHILQKALRDIGEDDPGYNFLSIRRSFLRRCRDKLGPVAAFYFSGLARFGTLSRTLRREPEWSHMTSLLDSQFEP